MNSRSITFNPPYIVFFPIRTTVSQPSSGPLMNLNIALSRKGKRARWHQCSCGTESLKFRFLKAKRQFKFLSSFLLPWPNTTMDSEHFCMWSNWRSYKGKQEWIVWSLWVLYSITHVCHAQLQHQSPSPALKPGIEEARNGSILPLNGYEEHFP